MIITRDNIIVACKSLYITNRIEIPIILPIISSYCEEKGKSGDSISKLLTALQANMALLEQCFITALEYFERKFTICKLYKVIEPNQKQILNIY